MKIRNQHQNVLGLIILIFSGIGLANSVFAAPKPVATYQFDNSFSALEQNIVAITPIDPLSENSFMTDVVFGEERTVYRFDNNLPFDEQAGLLLFSRSGLGNSDVYSVELVFQFEASESSSYKNIFGVSNRQNDNAFYINPDNNLEVYPDLSGDEVFTFDTYHHVVLTYNGSERVSVYLDGVLQSQGNSTSMNFAAYSGNPERLIHFFVDNGSEVSDGRVALIRLYDTELSMAEVQEISSNPFDRCTATFSPEGALFIPCIRITDEFGVVSMFEAEFQLTTANNSPSFRLVAAQQINLNETNDNNCTADYSSVDTILSLPCINVFDIFGGSAGYSADLELVTGANPLTLSLKQAKRRN